MITNNVITYYSKGLNPTTRLEVWTRYVFNDVWLFGGKGSGINKGYEKANDVNVRIPLKYVEDFDIFKIGDIVAVGNQNEITEQSDLEGKEYYNITSININNFGYNPHIHLGGR